MSILLSLLIHVQGGTFSPFMVSSTNIVHVQGGTYLSLDIMLVSSTHMLSFTRQDGVVVSFNGQDDDMVFLTITYLSFTRGSTWFTISPFFKHNWSRNSTWSSITCLSSSRGSTWFTISLTVTWSSPPIHSPPPNLFGNTTKLSCSRKQNFSLAIGALKLSIESVGNTTKLSCSRKQNFSLAVRASKSSILLANPVTAALLVSTLSVNSWTFVSSGAIRLIRLSSLSPRLSSLPPMDWISPCIEASNSTIHSSFSAWDNFLKWAMSTFIASKNFLNKNKAKK